MRNIPGSWYAALVVLLLVAGLPAYSQTIHATDQFTVVDANGKKVGPVLGIESTAVVGFKVDGVPIALSVYRTFFQGDSVYWASSDCSGTPLLGLPSAPHVFALAGVAVPGNTLYFPVPNAEEQHVATGSRWLGGACVYSYKASPRAVPARAVLNLDDFFTPPFSLR